MSSRHVFIGLGSNVGEREATLHEALTRLTQRGFHLLHTSRLYSTEPVGGPPQEWFLNQVALGTTTLEPEELLSVCLDLEHELGRVRRVRNGPRTLDLDLLLFEGEQRETETLTLPHPRLHERRFVLVPLCELAPDERHPILGLTVTELLERCPDTSAVEPYAGAVAP